MTPENLLLIAVDAKKNPPEKSGNYLTDMGYLSYNSIPKAFSKIGWTHINSNLLYPQTYYRHATLDEIREMFFKEELKEAYRQGDKRGFAHGIGSDANDNEYLFNKNFQDWYEQKYKTK